MKDTLPEVYEQFQDTAKKLENHYKDMQDLKLLKKGKLYMLQTRNGKRALAASIKIAVDMVNEMLFQKALVRVNPIN